MLVLIRVRSIPTVLVKYPTLAVAADSIERMKAALPLCLSAAGQPRIEQRRDYSILLDN